MDVVKLRGYVVVFCHQRSLPQVGMVNAETLFEKTAFFLYS